MIVFGLILPYPGLNSKQIILDAPGKAMNDELLSIVDANDKVIGTRPRNEIHALGLRHRAVHILVFNSQNQLFLQKRANNKDINPGLWDTSAAGHVDAGEEYYRCAIRELKEELAITCMQLHKLFKLTATLATGMEFIQVYRCFNDGPFKLAPDEIDQGCWNSIAEINSRVDEHDSQLTESFKTLWQQFRML